MGRYSNYDVKRPRDFWPTVDPDAVRPLSPFIKGDKYVEPCAGAGDLINLIGDHATCVKAYDLEPQSDKVIKKDALTLEKKDLYEATVLITNPPFSWDLVQPLLEHLPTLKPTWMLLPASVMHNKRMGVYMKRCARVVSIGRLYWINKDAPNPNEGKKGKEDYCWYRFHSSACEEGTLFYGRS